MHNYIKPIHVQAVMISQLWSTVWQKHLVNVTKTSLGYKIKNKNKKNYFMGGRTCQVGSVGRAFFFFSGSKNDPKNTKKIWKKIGPFLQKSFCKIYWLIFRNFQPKFLDFGKKKWLILQNFRGKKVCQNGKFGLVRPIKHSFFHGLMH